MQIPSIFTSNFSNQNYPPFGMVMPGRSFTSESYRFGFNGMEKDGEIKGNGNEYTTEFRQYDPRLGRWTSLDPLMSEFAHSSPYAAFANNPIYYTDPYGLKPGGNENQNDSGDGGGAEVEYVVDSEKAGSSTIENGRYITYVVDKYEIAILQGRLLYSNNYGWVDMAHASTPSENKKLGADNLWNRIENESGEVLNVKSPDGSGENGYLLTYRQDARATPLLPRIGVSAVYWVKSGLNEDEKMGVAMAILQEVSTMFESSQAKAWWSGSSFSPEDLTSNLLGLYDAMFVEVSMETIMSAIEPLSPQQSAAVYRQYEGMFNNPKYKNYDFSPKFFPNTISPDNCGKVPEMLRSVQPADIGAGSNVMRWKLIGY